MGSTRYITSMGELTRKELEFIEKNKTDRKILYLDLNEDTEEELNKYVKEIEEFIEKDDIPKTLNKPKCKKCSYYEYCYI